MKLTYNLDIDDWSVFQRYHFSVSPAYRRMRNYSRFLFPAAALLLIGAHCLKHGFDLYYPGIFGTFALAWFFLYPRLFDRRVTRRSNRFIREGDTGGMFGQRELELLPDQVHLITSSADTTLRASAILEVVEIPEALLLYVASVQAIVIPKREVSPEEFQAAVAFAQQHYSKQAV